VTTKRVLVLAATTGYQTRSFGEAAERLGVELVFATDRCHLIDDPWQDQAIPIRFHDEDGSVAAILEAAKLRGIDGVLAVGDRPTVIAARVAATLGLPWHPTDAAAVARHKQRTRERLRAAGLPVPWFLAVTLAEGATAGQRLSYPCVVKPMSLSGSRGVMRADDPASFATAFERLRALLRSPEVRAERNEAHETALVEGFIPGREYAVEALLDHGTLHVLAIFDKPEPLDGPFFEETIYVTPSSAPGAIQERIVEAVAGAARAIGLHHGPVHAECRVNGDGVFVLEAAARPIGGLCARALRFQSAISNPAISNPAISNPAINNQSAICNLQSAISLEALLLRHALGEDPGAWCRERDASGVMMIPIPRRGIFRAMNGVEAAREVAGIDEIRITAKPDQLLVPLPEGASYLGFIFARAPHAAGVEQALRAAHSRLTLVVDPEFPVLTAAQIQYNLHHG
jgi:hypothetical protein